jgi:HSP20 family protein
LFDGGLDRRTDDAMETWYPKVDVSENENEYVINAELPGIKKPDVKVVFENGILTVSGERSEEKKEKNARYHLVERSWGAFRRSFTLPGNVSADKIAADFKDGVLTVHAPKSETAKPKQIAVS